MKENKKEKKKKEARPHGERSEDGQEGDLRRHEQLGPRLDWHSAQPDHSGTRPMVQVTAAAATLQRCAACTSSHPLALNWL